jgi:hypothetical protein
MTANVYVHAIMSLQDDAAARINDILGVAVGCATSGDSGGGVHNGATRRLHKEKNPVDMRFHW